MTGQEFQEQFEQYLGRKATLAELTRAVEGAGYRPENFHPDRELEPAAWNGIAAGKFLGVTTDWMPTRQERRRKTFWVGVIKHVTWLLIEFGVMLLVGWGVLIAVKGF